MTNTLNQEQIKELIPHREPMLLIDRVMDYDMQALTIHAQKDIDPAWDIFEGHFPDAPIMPGVLITEAMAQAGAVTTNLLLGENAQNSLFYFVALENVRFRHPVNPGDVLDLKVKLVKKKASMLKFEAEAFVADKLVTNAAFTAKVIVREEV